MRLHRLELSAFLAFPGREVVDFDELGEAGLFLLHGRTGAGKTSLLDAVCFALYGDVPGARSGGARLRSDHAPAGVRTEVVLEATLRGRRVRVMRAPEQQRPKRRGDGVTTDAHAVSVVRIRDDGAEEVLATRHDEAARELGDLLGMTREQFCQVVLLPQGGFARFLHARQRRARQAAARAVRRRALRGRRAVAARPPPGGRARAGNRHGRRARRGVARRPGRRRRAAGGLGRRGPTGAAGWLEELLVVAEANATTAAGAAQHAEERRDAVEAQLAAATVLAARQAQGPAAARELEAWEAGRPERDHAAEQLAAARRAAPAQAHVEHLRARAQAAADAGRVAADAVAAARDAGVEVRQPEPAADGRLFDLDAPAQSELLRVAAGELREAAGAAGRCSTGSASCAVAKRRSPRCGSRPSACRRRRPSSAPR